MGRPEVQELTEDQRVILRMKLRELGEEIRREGPAELTQPEVRHIVRTTARDLYKPSKGRR